MIITNSQASIKDNRITLSLVPKNHPFFKASMVAVTLFLSEYLAAGAAEAPQPMAGGNSTGVLFVEAGC